METTNYIGVLYGGLNSNNGKENGNYYGILGFYMGVACSTSRPHSTSMMPLLGKTPAGASFQMS